MVNDTEVIWQELHHDLAGFIGKRVSNTDAIDDILQDVFLKIHAQSNTLRDDQRLVSWAFQITRNAIVDYYRSRKVNLELPESLPFEDDSDDDDLAAHLAPCLRPMIDNLPGKYREALILTEYQGLSQNELAQQLGISVSGAKSRVQRAKEQLKEMLLQCCHFELDRRGHIIDYYPVCC